MAVIKFPGNLKRLSAHLCCYLLLSVCWAIAPGLAAQDLGPQSTEKKSPLSLNVDSQNWHTKAETAMGTRVSVTLWHKDEGEAKSLIAAVMEEMHRIDAAFSPYKPESELSRLNRLGGKAPVKVSPEMAQLLDKSLYFSRLSEGAFDITFASVGYLYDYRKGKQPDAQTIGELLPAVDYRQLNWQTEQRQLSFNLPQIRIDLGGVAKGYAVDRAVEMLRQAGVGHATVSAGGDSRVLGDKLGKPWMIGIKKPRGLVKKPSAVSGEPRLGEVAIMLPLINTAISTSGDYERFFIDEDSGERIHHILNPRTGRSATEVVSVSVLGPRSFDTDPMSTAVFVLGVAPGLSLINRLPKFEAVIIDRRGKVHYSKGLQPPEPQG